MFNRIEDIMTTAPRTIGARQALDVARDMMRAFDVRHLPVLDEGRLVGVLSEEALSEPRTATTFLVAERMNPGPLTVAPSAAVADVARMMLDLKLDVVLVVDGSKLLGIVTTVDLLRAFVTMLDGSRVVRREAVA